MRRVPYLQSAARFHGEPADARCPICRREQLINVNYIYGDELKGSAGQARPAAELKLLAARVREFQVYVVEVCRGCGWNHLMQRYVLGTTSGTAGPGTGGAGTAEPAPVRYGAARAGIGAGPDPAGRTGRQRSAARALSRSGGGRREVAE